MKKEEAKQMENIYKVAHLAGLGAVEAMTPTPMIVSQHSRMTDDSSPIDKQYVVMDGVCGFAWIKIRPASCKFVKWCKENEIGHKDSYEGGYSIWVSQFNQSYERKYAYAKAFAEVLVKNGIKAYGSGRLD